MQGNQQSVNLLHGFIVNRIGQEAVDEIESNHNRYRWTVEECKAIKAEYQQKLKDLRNSRSEVA
ncbi:hypothetical protein BTQ08_09500 [Escherichia coli]|nr:hypothetical protein BTQ08_09500 [Escherichia coli]